MNPPPRIIIWGLNYAPEPAGIAPYTTDLANHLQQAGWSVEMVAGFPYYPAWRKAPEDRRLFRRDEIAGVTVHRCWQYVPAQPGVLGRMLHEISFAFTSLYRVLTLRRADLYVVMSPPLGLGLMAWCATRLKRSAFLFHVQDLQPDSAIALGMVRNGAAVWLLRAVERFIYNRAAGVSGISPGMTDAFRAKGVPPAKVFLLPNWLRRPVEPASEEAAQVFRRRYDIPAEALLAVYSGNLGRKQGLEILLTAAARLTEAGPTARPIVMVIAGDGAGRPALEALLASRPTAGVRLLPLLPTDEYQAMLRAADVALITQLSGTGACFFPSKLLTVLAAGLPVIAVADDDTELARAVVAGRFGCCVSAGDATALTRVLRASAAAPDALREWAAHTSWVRQFSSGPLLEEFATVLNLLAVRRAGAQPALAEVPDPSR